jgi:preprotein translocase subunit SecF
VSAVTGTPAGFETGHSERRGIWSRLFRGETSFDFVGHWRRWFGFSAVVIIVGMAALGYRGLNFGIEFKGGTSWQVPTRSVSVVQAKDALGAIGRNAVIETIGTGRTRTLQVEAKLPGTVAQQAATSSSVTRTLAHLAHVSPSVVSTTQVGPTWGGQITDAAIKALIIFFICIGLYITFRFEWKMAAAALVAVFHDLVVTVGIYALVGFPVTPATVVAVLTILGYSLYDTIVVFDRVKENAQGLGGTGRLTYSDIVNLSMNQVLMRSLNTSIVAILPILSILVLGAEILGATTLQEFGLALVIGLTSGAYSSIFVASPLLALIKEKEPRYRAIRRKLEARGEGSMLLTPAAVAAMTSAGGSSRPAALRPGSYPGGPRPPKGARAGAPPRLVPKSRAGNGSPAPRLGGEEGGPARRSPPQPGAPAPPPSVMSPEPSPPPAPAPGSAPPGLSPSPRPPSAGRLAGEKPPLLRPGQARVERPTGGAEGKGAAGRPGRPPKKGKRR